MQKVSVQTAQNVTIDYPLASVGDRMLAYLLDLLIICAWSGLWFVVMALTEVSGATMEFIYYTIISLPWLCYQLVCEIFFNGQSVGKMTLKIRVISLDGVRPGLGGFFMRWVFRVIDIALNYGAVAIVTISASKKGQRVGDMVGGTTVIKLRKLEAVTGEQLFAAIDKQGYEVKYPEASRLSDQDVQIIQEALRRYRINRKRDVVEMTNERVRQTLGIDPTEEPFNFLNQVVKDHIALARQSA